MFKVPAWSQVLEQVADRYGIVRLRSEMTAIDGGAREITVTDHANGTQETSDDHAFALGDVAHLPSSKTGAAVRKQAPVVVGNLLDVMNGGTPSHRYDGYTSCPLVTARDRMVLAEFDYDLPPTHPLPAPRSLQGAVRDVGIEAIRPAVALLARHAHRPPLTPPLRCTEVIFSRDVSEYLTDAATHGFTSTPTTRFPTAC